MSDDETSNRWITRRRVLQGGGVAAAAAGAGFGVLSLGSDGASASVQVSGISAADVSVSTADGRLNTFTIDPTVTVEWEGFEEPAGTMTTRVSASVGGTKYVVASESYHYSRV